MPVVTFSPTPRGVSQTVATTARPYLDAGFCSFDEVVEIVSELLEDDLDPDDAGGLTTDDLRTQLAKLWDARVAEQAAWDVSDADRLTDAFAELEVGGIIARMNYACCGTCGHYEIATIERPAWSGATPATGYVFFHQQAGERIADGDVYLGHAAFTDGLDEAAATAVELGNGRRIVEVLTAHGLSASWTGSMAQNIHVALPDWRRHLPARKGPAGGRAA